MSEYSLLAVEPGESDRQGFADESLSQELGRWPVRENMATAVLTSLKLTARSTLMPHGLTRLAHGE